MKCISKLLLVVALLLPAIPARAAVAHANAAVVVNFLETSDGTWAFVRVSARYQLPLMGDLTILRNGDVLKVEPVVTSQTVLITAFLGPNDKDYAVCAAFAGETHVGGDNYLPASAKTCGLRSRSMPITHASRPGARAPRPAGLGPAALPVRD